MGKYLEFKIKDDILLYGCSFQDSSGNRISPLEVKVDQDGKYYHDTLSIKKVFIYGNGWIGVNSIKKNISNHA